MGKLRRCPECGSAIERETAYSVIVFECGRRINAEGRTINNYTKQCRIIQAESRIAELEAERDDLIDRFSVHVAEAMDLGGKYDAATARLAKLEGLVKQRDSLARSSFLSGYYMAHDDTVEGTYCLDYDGVADEFMAGGFREHLAELRALVTEGDGDAETPIQTR